MILRNLEEILNSKYDVSGDNWSSRRLLLHKDGMGFSMTDTIIKKGTETYLWYKNHFEACYCIDGEGEIELADKDGNKTGEIHKIFPGVLYALDKHDKHYLRAINSDLRLVCTFNPPLTGEEIHDEEGTYPAITK